VVSIPLDIALDALRLIADNDCERVAKPYPRCSTGKPGYTRGDGWCLPCVAVDALARIVAGGIPAPSWQDILTRQRDEAVDHAERLVIVANRMWDSWNALRRGAEAVLAVPQETVDTVRDLSGGAS
jgi:hypothetical protein